MDFNLRAKSITINNRKPLRNSYLENPDKLDVVMYEGSEVVVKPLGIGQSVTLRFDTQRWRYSNKRRTLQRIHYHTGYSENINILASIYAVEDYNHITRPSSSNGLILSFNLLMICLSLILLNNYIF